MKLPKLSPTMWAAVMLVVVAVAAFAAWFTTNALDEWAPNIATEALSIAVTIAIVERIVRREATERLRPRLERILSGIGHRFHSFIEVLALDYATTHLRTFHPLPTDALALINHWLKRQQEEDATRLEVLDGADPALFGHAEGLATSLQRYRESDRDILEPDLIAAMDDFADRVSQAQVLYRLSRRDGRAEPDDERIALRRIVLGARNFGEILLRHDAQWQEVPEPLISSAMSLRDRLLTRTSQASETTSSIVQDRSSKKPAMGMLHDPLTGQHLQFLRTGKQTGGQLLEAEVLLDPGGHVPRDLHLRQDERVEVLEGSLSIQVGAEQRRLAQGESVEVPRRTLHRVRNIHEGRTRLLLQIRPARRMQAAIRAIFTVAGVLGRLRHRHSGSLTSHCRESSQ